MKIKVIPSSLKGVHSIVLFTEDKLEDFLVSPVLNIVEDLPDDPETKKAKIYAGLPSSVLTSNRACIVARPSLQLTTEIQQGVTDEQNRLSSKSIRKNGQGGRLMFKTNSV